MKIVLLLLCIFLIECQCQSVCPSNEDIKPCVCKIDTDKKPWIACEGISSANELRKSVSAMKGYKISNFYLEKSNINVLPADIFSNFEIQYLSILFTNLTSLSENQNRPPFLGQENSLESIEIRDGFLDDRSPLTKLSLSHLKKLNFLQLEGNIMPLIPNSWFESGPYGLKDVYLLVTSTSKVGSHAFASLTNMRMFSLTGGHFSEIKRDMFPNPALSLSSLDLSNNQIETLPNDIFSNMPSLSEVFLDNNGLTTISETVFAPVWSQLQYAYFYGNPIKCDKDVKWMFKYRLPEYITGYCVSPPKLLYRVLSNLTITDFE